MKSENDYCDCAAPDCGVGIIHEPHCSSRIAAHIISECKKEIEHLVIENKLLKAKLTRAFTEIRKQVFASKVVFDREICDEAEKENPGNRF